MSYITYKYKLYNNSSKLKRLNHKIDTASWVYNHCIALTRQYYNICGKDISFNKLKSHIAKLRRTYRPEWKDINAQTVQDVIERLEKSYKSFFTHQRNGDKRARLPHFVKRINYKSITYKQAGWKIDGNKIRLDGINIGFWKSREFNGVVKTITLKRDYRGHLYVYIVVDEDIKSVKPRTGKAAGFDFGLKHFLTDNNGNTYDVPRSYLKHQKELRRASRSVSRKVKGSNRRRKAICKLNAVHIKIVNSRRDWQYKLANDLVSKYDTLVFEDLSFKGMGRLWGKKIHDLAPAEFFNKISWIASKNNKDVVFIDRWFPSTKICSVCGALNENLTLRDRRWVCDCGAIHNRDTNAAINILQEGTSSCGVGGVSPVLV